MKILLFIAFLLFGVSSFGQAPALFIKLSTTDTAFGQNLPPGTLLYDMLTRKRYITLVPLASDKKISNSNKLLLDDLNVDPSGSTPEIKEIGTNSGAHYLGEQVSDGVTGDGIVVSIWTKNGIEECLLVALTDANAVASIYPSDASIPSGWRVPTLAELTVCFNAAIYVNSILPSAPFKPVTYWSSSLFDANNAYVKGFLKGDVPSYYPKASSTHLIRYVRVH